MRPPAVLTSARVTHYAIRDRTVGYTPRNSIYVGGKLLGAVPRLAIAHDGRTYLLMHCTRTWQVRSAFDHPSVAAAKQYAERQYPGLRTRWRSMGVTKAQAVAWSKRYWKPLACSFCGRPPYEVTFMFERKGVRLCDVCVDAAAAHVQRMRTANAISDKEREQRLREEIAEARQRRTSVHDV
jgi:hypothetical protein